MEIDLQQANFLSRARVLWQAGRQEAQERMGFPRRQFPPSGN